MASAFSSVAGLRVSLVAAHTVCHFDLVVSHPIRWCGHSWLPSAPAVTVPQTESDKLPRNAARPGGRAALVLSIGFTTVKLLRFVPRRRAECLDAVAAIDPHVASAAHFREVVAVLNETTKVGHVALHVVSVTSDFAWTWSFAQVEEEGSRGQGRDETGDKG